MDAPAVSTRRPADQVLLPALERGLDALAQQVRGDVEPPQFLRDLLRLLVHTARADEAAAWLRSTDGLWTRVGLQVSSTDGMTTSQTGLPAEVWLNQAVSTDGPQLTRLNDAVLGPRQRIAGPIRQGGTPVGVLEAMFDGGVLPAAATTLVPYCGALAELTGDFLVQHELRLLRRDRAEWKQWDQWLSAAQTVEGLASLADSITHDGRALTTSDRVTVLRLMRGRPRVASASGVDLIDPRSSTVQALERFAAAALRTRQDAWCGLDAETEGSHALVTSWQRLQQNAGTIAAGALILRRAGGAPTGVVICERFQAVTDSAAWRAKCETLARFAAPVWTAAVERATGPWARLWSQGHEALSPLGRTLRRAIITAVVVGGTASALTLVSADLVVTGEGKLLPANRRDIFATTTGIVEDVRVRHGDEVHAGDVLLVLRDPALELEATRIAGELSTVRTRLNVVQAARISGTGAAIDPVLRAQQLTGEETELQQRLESLTRQQELLAAERQSWTLTSPIDGQVLTWDVEPLLAGRPVQRGHVLLEVGATAGDWIVEVWLRERDAGFVFDEWNDGQNKVPVEFVPVTGRRWIAHGHIRDVARVTDIDERGDSSVRLIVAFDRAQAPELRSGKTVLPRIVCGRRALGYVWFRDLIDAVRSAWWRWS
jgi:multidrug efflux pump subunit AcrA (membrane-fusion protein)